MPCCPCRGDGSYVRCACVQAGRICEDCYPSLCNRCHNRTPNQTSRLGIPSLTPLLKSSAPLSRPVQSSVISPTHRSSCNLSQTVRTSSRQAQGKAMGSKLAGLEHKQSRTGRCSQEPSAISSSSSTSPASNQFQAVRHSPSSSVENAAATSPRAVTMSTTDISDIDSAINIAQLRSSNVQPREAF